MTSSGILSNLPIKICNFLTKIYSDKQKTILFITIYLSLYHLTLFIGNWPSGMEIVYELVWSVWMILFVVISPLIIMKEYKKLKDLSLMGLNLPKKYKKGLFGLFIIFNIIALCLFIYDLNFGLNSGFWLSVYGKNAVILHYSLMFLFGIPLFFFMINTAVTILYNAYYIAKNIGNIENRSITPKLFENFIKIKTIISAMDNLFVISFLLTSSLIIAFFIKVLFLNMDVLSYIYLITILLPFVIVSIFIMITIRNIIMKSVISVVTTMLKPKSFDTEEIYKKAYVLFLYTTKGSPYYLPLDNKGLLLKNIISFGAELIIMLLTFVINRVIT